MSERLRPSTKMIGFGLIALLLWSLTVLFVWAGIGNTYYGWVSQAWPVAEGIILRSEVEEIRVTEQRRDDSTVNARPPRQYLRYRPIIEYQWQVEGYTFSRDRRNYSSAIADEESRAEAEAIIAPYPVGAKILIHYDPDEPSRAILEPGPHWDGLSITMIAAMLLAAFAMTFSFLAWRSYIAG